MYVPKGTFFQTHFSYSPSVNFNILENFICIKNYLHEKISKNLEFRKKPFTFFLFCSHSVYLKNNTITMEKLSRCTDITTVCNKPYISSIEGFYWRKKNFELKILSKIYVRNFFRRKFWGLMYSIISDRTWLFYACFKHDLLFYKIK